MALQEVVVILGVFSIPSPGEPLTFCDCMESKLANDDPDCEVLGVECR